MQLHPESGMTFYSNLESKELCWSDPFYANEDADIDAAVEQGEQQEKNYQEHEKLAGFQLSPPHNNLQHEEVRRSDSQTMNRYICVYEAEYVLIALLLFVPQSFLTSQYHLLRDSLRLTQANQAGEKFLAYLEKGDVEVTEEDGIRLKFPEYVDLQRQVRLEESKRGA